MIDPAELVTAVANLKERIARKENLVQFTEMEIEELKRTIVKMEIRN